MATHAASRKRETKNLGKTPVQNVNKSFFFPEHNFLNMIHELMQNVYFYSYLPNERFTT